MRAQLAIPAAALVLLALAACAPAATAPEEAGSPVETPAVEHADYNAHGVLSMELGLPVTITFPGTEDVAVEFTVDSVQLDVKCTDQFAIPPMQGQFIALAVTVTTAENYEEISGNAPMRFYRNDFYSATSPESETVEAGSSVDCIEGGLPLDIPAGTTTTGLVLLDVPVGATSLVWEPSTFSVSVDGREWPLI